MRVFLVLLALLCACHREPQRTAEQRHWDSVATGPRWAFAATVGPEDTAWFDRESIVRTDSSRYEVWWKAVATSEGGGARYLSDVDCASRRFRQLKGERLDSAYTNGPLGVNQNAPWIAIVPEDRMERLFLSICSFAASRNLHIVRR